MEGSHINRAELAAIAEEAAQKALSRFFLMLDIDPDDKDSVRQFRDDLIFLSEQREGSVLLKRTLKKSAVYLVSGAFVGLVYFLWDIFKDGLILWVQKIN